MIINQDLHVHTHISLCAVASATAEAYIENARKLGLDTLGIANHMWDTENLPLLLRAEDYPERSYRWMQGYNKQNFAYIQQAKPEFDPVPHDDIRVLFGAKGEYDYQRRDIALTKENAEKLDFLLVPHSHTHLVMPAKFYESGRTHALFCYDSFMDVVHSDKAQYVTAIAHPFSTFEGDDVYLNLSEEEYAECFNEAKKADIAIEINTDSLRGNAGKTYGGVKSCGMMRMLHVARKCGCKFTFGTDTHSATGQDSLDYGYIAATMLELTEDDIIKL